MGLLLEKPTFTRDDDLVWEHEQAERHGHLQGDAWLLCAYPAGDQFTLSRIKLALGVDSRFEDVDFSLAA